MVACISVSCFCTDVCSRVEFSDKFSFIKLFDAIKRGGVLSEVTVDTKVLKKVKKQCNARFPYLRMSKSKCKKKSYCSGISHTGPG